MVTRVLKNPRTAKLSDSVWNELPETTFREHLVELEKNTNAVPIDPQTFNLSGRFNDPGKDRESQHTLPLYIEQQVANNVAFIAAVEEGAQSVAAVCLEEWIRPTALKIRIAAVDVIDNGVLSSLQRVAALLVEVATRQGAGVENATNSVFKQILQLHFRRLLGRLRSSRWTKPTHLVQSHKKPLWQDFDNLIHRVQFLYTKKEKTERNSLEIQLRDLAAVYKGFESVPGDGNLEFEYLRELVRSSYSFCKSTHIRQFLSRLEGVHATAQIASALKCLRQIEKIGAYWRAATCLVGASSESHELFANLELEYLTPYASVPTTIAYESWAKTCHVHAEIQLVVDLDLRDRELVNSSSNGGRNVCPPRVLGTSKQLCYLCYLFLQYHGRLYPTHTHGRLYDQWTVPDLAEFADAQRQQYRDVLCQIDRTVAEMARRPASWRAEPMTSRQDLINESQEISS